MNVRVSTDIGGTFTDLVYIDNDDIRAVKTDTTPGNLELGVTNAVAKTGLNYEQIGFFAHGTTVVINTLTERQGAKTALFTTEGFRDVLEIARGNTPDIFNAAYRKPAPFVPRYLRLEVPERLDAEGKVLRPLDDTGLSRQLAMLRAEGVEAIAICFLHAYQNPAHEQQLARLISAQWPAANIVCSHQVTREWREYERTNSAVLSAYVMPRTRQYLDRLDHTLRERGLTKPPYIMESNGGVMPLASARDNPIALVESGPVGGILGAEAYGRLIGHSEILALDIGGTTAKCSLIHEGRVNITTDYIIERSATCAGYPIKTPVVDIVEIGNGGGSIAWVDAGGGLRVGPKSAGSQPGPVAYGRGGTAPTTTDANLYTGRINPDAFAGGEIQPDIKGLEQAFVKLADQLGVTPIEMAHGVLDIANANMVNALKLISVNRGYDPRDFSLMAFGGGGAMHAAALARELNIPKVIIPPFAGVFSAWGMLLLDVRRDYIQTHFQILNAEHLNELECAFALLEAKALECFGAEGFHGNKLRMERFIDARYSGQEHSVKIAVDEIRLARVCDSFHDEHQRQYHFSLNAPIEVVNIHLAVFGKIKKAKVPELEKAPSTDGSPAIIGHRHVDFTIDERLKTPIYDRARLLSGMCFAGPAIIEEATTTTVVHPRDRVEVDTYGGLHIHIHIS